MGQGWPAAETDPYGWNNSLATRRLARTFAGDVVTEAPFTFDDLVAVQADAEAAIAAIRCSLNAGDELHSALCASLGYGRDDERLRAFMRVTQKAIERFA
jgi:hypothetical protein